jgi:hypothetical protein
MAGAGKCSPPGDRSRPVEDCSLSLGERVGVRGNRTPNCMVTVQTAACVPLRVRSYYTFLDSTLSPAAIADCARQHGLRAVALTDIGNLHGAVEFAQAAKRAGITPIF